MTQSRHFTPQCAQNPVFATYVIADFPASNWGTRDGRPQAPVGLLFIVGTWHLADINFDAENVRFRAQSRHPQFEI
jgi:hypothetical protein